VIVAVVVYFVMKFSLLLKIIKNSAAIPCYVGILFFVTVVVNSNLLLYDEIVM
jgi:hypothetical protein